MGNEAVHDALATGLVKVDGELVAVHLCHLAVAKLFVEHPLPLRIARSAGRGGDELTFERDGRAGLGRAFPPTALFGALPARRGVAARKSGCWFIEAAVAVGV